MSKRLRGGPDQAAGAPASAAALALEAAISELEQRLVAMSVALRSGESAVLDTAATQLQASVARSGQWAQQLSAKHAPLLAPHRDRLRRAAAELQAQREALARAGAALDRAAQVLVPADGRAYDAQGLGQRQLPAGGLTA